MKLNAINHFKDAFADHLMQHFQKGSVYEEGFKWDVIHQWKSNFSLEELEVHPRFDQSLQNEYSGRLWAGEKFSIKSEMISLMKQNPLLMREAFKDLFNETKDIDMRFSRFLFHCDQTLQELYDKDDRYNDHKQSNYSISLYLSLQFPDQYGLYEYEKFYKFMELVENRNIPSEQEKDRHFKSMRALYQVIAKDQEFMNGLNFMIKDRSFTDKSLFLINDFIDFTLEHAS